MPTPTDDLSDPNMASLVSGAAAEYDNTLEKAKSITTPVISGNLFGTAVSVVPIVTPTVSPCEVTTVEELRENTTAVKLTCNWFGVRRSLSQDQKAQAAKPFDASADYLSASKKLIDTKHPAFKAVTKIRGKARQFWCLMTTPYPEDGLRLLRRDMIDEFDKGMSAIHKELIAAVLVLNESYSELRELAQQRLGSLYNPTDYPVSLDGLFEIGWEFMSVEPPDYLKKLNPKVWERERQRVAARYNEAISLAEQAFTEELAKLVSHLIDRLSPSEDGKSKRFKDATIDNLQEFFDRFKKLSLNPNPELDVLIKQAEVIIAGADPTLLRNRVDVREGLRANFSDIKAKLDTMVVNKPTREINFDE